MTHDEAQALFTARHDGELDAVAAADFEDHLSSCASCRAEWQEFERALGEVSGLRVLAPPADFVRRVEKTIDRRSRGRFFGAPEPGAFAFVVGAVVVVLLLAAWLAYEVSREIVIPLPPPAVESPTATNE